MDDISIKILDALFDLCDGENYVILDAQDLTSRIPDHTFQPNELVEILETLDADDLLDLRYADEAEFCVAMKMKGRSLIKQFRDRLQKMVAATEPISVSSPTEDAVRSDVGDAEESAPGQTPVYPRRERSSFDYEQRTRSADRSRPLPADRREYEEDKPAKLPVEKKVLLFAALGGAVGALVVNVVFLILFFLLK